MSAMEMSLRRALDAGDARDPAFREQVYSASERALEKMIEAKAMEPEAAHRQRVRLAETINRVEDDHFRPAEADAGAMDGAAARSGDGRFGDDAGGKDRADDRPGLEATDAQGLTDDESEAAERNDVARDGFAEGGDPGLGAEIPETAADGAGSPQSEAASGRPKDGAASPDDVWSPGSAKPRAGKGFGERKPSRAFAAAVLVALLALLAGIYVLYTSVFEPLDAAPAAATQGATQELTGGVSTLLMPARDQTWISLFDGKQLETLATPTGGRIETISGDGDSPAVRLEAASEGGEINLAIGPGVVGGIKGRRVRVEIAVGSADGKARGFTVRCLFGGDTVCGRQRFDTLEARTAFVFDMTVPKGVAYGTLAIDPSAGALPGNLDLYSVRLHSLEEV